MKGADIENYVFDKGAFGYKVEDVKAFLKDVSTYVISLEDTIDKNEQEIERLKEQTDRYEDGEDSVKEIIISAQKFKTSVINDAKEQADEILSEIESKKANFDDELERKTSGLVAEAKVKADKIISSALIRSNDMMRDTRTKFENESRQLKLIKKEVSDFKSKLLALYKSHLDIITKIPEFVEEPKDEIKNEKDANLGEEKSSDSNDQVDSNEQIDSNVVDNKNEAGSDSKNDDAPIFKVSITENSNSPKEEVVGNSDYVKSRFSELKFGENNVIKEK